MQPRPRNLAAELTAMSSSLRLRALVAACRSALAVWQSQKEPMEYVDTVVGMRHVVDRELPARTLRALRNVALVDIIHTPTLDALALDYREPTVALQDDDWHLGDAATSAYYAIYNLLRFVRNEGGVTPELVLTQAIECQGTEPDVVEQNLAGWWTVVCALREADECPFTPQVRAHGPIADGARRVFILDVATRTTLRDFPAAHEAIAYANDVAWEDALNIALVFDDLFALVHRGTTQPISHPS